jgi:hypothetical protein
MKKLLALFFISFLILSSAAFAGQYRDRYRYDRDHQRNVRILRTPSGRTIIVRPRSYHRGHYRINRWNERRYDRRYNRDYRR